MPKVIERRGAHFRLCPISNVAETIVAVSTETVQMGNDPEQLPPLQPVNEAPWWVGVAVSVSSVPPRYPSEQTTLQRWGDRHVEPQLIPDGTLVTMPGPDVLTVTG